MRNATFQIQCLCNVLSAKMPLSGRFLKVAQMDASLCLDKVAETSQLILKFPFFCTITFLYTTVQKFDQK